MMDVFEHETLKSFINNSLKQRFNRVVFPLTTNQLVDKKWFWVKKETVIEKSMRNGRNLKELSDTLFRCVIFISIG